MEKFFGSRHGKTIEEGQQHPLPPVPVNKAEESHLKHLEAVLKSVDNDPLTRIPLLTDDISVLWSHIPQQDRDVHPMWAELNDTYVGNVKRYVRDQLDFYARTVTPDPHWGQFQVMKVLDCIREEAFESIGEENASRLLKVAKAKKLKDIK